MNELAWIIHGCHFHLANFSGVKGYDSARALRALVLKDTVMDEDDQLARNNHFCNLLSLLARFALFFNLRHCLIFPFEELTYILRVCTFFFLEM